LDICHSGYRHPDCSYRGLLQSEGYYQDRQQRHRLAFIRYTVLSISLPIVAILALNQSLTGEAATLIAGAMGYAFGKVSE